MRLRENEKSERRVREEQEGERKTTKRQRSVVEKEKGMNYVFISSAFLKGLLLPLFLSSLSPLLSAFLLEIIRAYHEGWSKRFSQSLE